jgi:hypothetical protein
MPAHTRAWGANCIWVRLPIGLSLDPGTKKRLDFCTVKQDTPETLERLRIRTGWLEAPEPQLIDEPAD